MLPAAELELWQRELDASGVAVLDVHGPHCDASNLWAADASDRQHALELCRHRLELTAALRGDAMVYHVPTAVAADAVAIEHFVDGLARLEDQARDAGVLIALENHYRSDNDQRAFTRCFERFSPDYIGFCLDPGHAMISGNLDWLLDNCAERLRVLHCNENDSQDDLHWNPYQKADEALWSRITRAIAASPYDKPVQLEVCWKPELHPEHSEFLAQAAVAARRLQSAIDAQR